MKSDGTVIVSVYLQVSTGTPLLSFYDTYASYTSSGLSCALSKDQSCQLDWTVNATGAINSEWKVGVLFNSSYTTVSQNHTDNATIRITENIPPKYSLNSTNSTTVGTAILHSLYWTDNVGLSGYIFQFCNGTWSESNCLGNNVVIDQLLSNSTNKVYYSTSQSTQTTPAIATTDFIDTEYNKTNVSDNNRYELSINSLVTGERWRYNRFNFSLSAFGTINSLQYCFEGYWTNTIGEESGYGKLYYYNNTSASWVFDQNISYGSETTICKTFNNPNDVLNANKEFQFGSEIEAVGEGAITATTISIDFINLTVNSTTGWVNDAWVSMTGTGNWSNVTKTVNDTIGANIAWCVYANDTSNNWNGSSCQNPFTYITTSAPYLEVNLIYPPLNLNVNQNTTFNVNATVTCKDAPCGNVYGTVRYNASSANPDIAINTTQGDKPFYIAGNYSAHPYTNESVGDSLPDDPANASDDGFNDTSTYAYFYSSCEDECEDSESVAYIWDFDGAPTGGTLFYTWKYDESESGLSGATARINFYNWGTSSWNQIRSVGVDEAWGTYSLNIKSTYFNSTGGVKVQFAADTVSLGAGDAASATIWLNDTYVSARSNTQFCGSLSKDQSCQLNWTVNATGTINSEWKVGVLFNSSLTGIADNHTNNATIAIIAPEPSITLWSPPIIDFASQNPSTYWNNATNNTNNFYNITVDPISCSPIDIWIKGTDLENITLSTIIGVGNITWNNYDNYTTSINMSTTYVLINASLSPNTNVTTYYWLNVPAVYAGGYNGTATICGNCTPGGCT